MNPKTNPPYEPHKWNRAPAHVKLTHNCYTYMLNDLHHTERTLGKPQPGQLANWQMHGERLSCKVQKAGVMNDNPELAVLSLQKGRDYQCPPGYYMGYMMVAKGQDFHFARQDNRMIPVYRALFKSGIYKPTVKELLEYSRQHIPEIVELAHIGKSNSKESLRRLSQASKTWSHKRGGSDVTDRDAAGQLILQPEYASWDYGALNYKQGCCYFVVPNNAISHTKSSGALPHTVRKDLGPSYNDIAYESYVLRLLERPQRVQNVTKANARGVTRHRVTNSRIL